MRYMSFRHTAEQLLAGEKTVTRCFGWLFLKPGDLVQPVRQVRGLKRGQKVKKLGKPIRIVKVNIEALEDVTQEECQLEGFPNLSPQEFVEMFCRINRCPDYVHVTRIEFEATGTGKEKKP